jgi:hypothetical protein
MRVPLNHPFIDGFSIVNHPFGGTPIYGTVLEPKTPFIAGDHRTGLGCGIG